MAKVHPTFFTDTMTWEVDGFVAKSLRALKQLLPKNTRIVGYYPKGYPQIKYDKDTDEDFTRALMQHFKTKKYTPKRRHSVPKTKIRHLEPC